MASSRRGRAKHALEDPVGFMGTLREMAYIMREQAAAAHQMMEQMGKQLEECHGGNPYGAKVDLEYLKFAEFWNANPHSFRSFQPR